MIEKYLNGGGEIVACISILQKLTESMAKLAEKACIVMKTFDMTIHDDLVRTYPHDVFAPPGCSNGALCGSWSLDCMARLVVPSLTLGMFTERDLT